MMKMPKPIITTCGSSTCIAARHTTAKCCTDEHDNEDKASDTDGDGDSMRDAIMMTCMAKAKPMHKMTHD